MDTEIVLAKDATHAHRCICVHRNIRIQLEIVEKGKRRYNLLIKHNGHKQFPSCHTHKKNYVHTYKQRECEEGENIRNIKHLMSNKSALNERHQNGWARKPRNTVFCIRCQEES